MNRAMKTTDIRQRKIDTALAGPDPMTRQFCESLSDSRMHDQDAHARIVALALSYAKEAEQRILELNARVSQLESLSQTDELTGLLNRRGFNHILERNLLSANRYEETGLLAYIDLDGFKSINDLHGHSTGDEVLRSVGRLLKKSIRATDYAARIGGDEFAILFVRADHMRARERAKELTKAVNKLTLEHPDGRIAIHASLGIATYDGDTDQQALIERADRAMYLNKKKGSRNWRLTTHG
ncbi:MAG: diguanylate cyclase [Rhizobiales bacterium]|nr:diguanylate cyclase [Hyphomicrobiales bacterium]